MPFYHIFAFPATIYFLGLFKFSLVTDEEGTPVFKIGVGKKGEYHGTGERYYTNGNIL